ncbi:MAG: hypothetical protein K0U41_06840 [Gammaproteobacteria bacterium]|nr:hypothetical protein [Gammaproteobacteria bacterium]
MIQSANIKTLNTYAKEAQFGCPFTIKWQGHLRCEIKTRDSRLARGITGRGAFAQFRLGGPCPINKHFWLEMQTWYVLSTKYDSKEFVPLKVQCASITAAKTMAKKLHTEHALKVHKAIGQRYKVLHEEKAAGLARNFKAFDLLWKRCKQFKLITGKDILIKDDMIARHMALAEESKQS